MFPPADLVDPDAEQPLETVRVELGGDDTPVLESETFHCGGG